MEFLNVINALLSKLELVKLLNEVFEINEKGVENSGLGNEDGRFVGNRLG
jgi:hypothetical protein